MSSTNTLYLVFLTTGFTVGFGHCIGMCGPIVASLSLNLRRKKFLSHCLYNAGRITTYSFLGGIMGWTGAFTQITTSIAHLQKGVMIFAGFVVIVMALAMNGWLPLGSIFGDGYVPLGTISRVFRKLVVSQSSLTYYLLGLLLGLLPCGPVYTALVAAARLGMDASDTVRGFLSGMGVMLAFGIGTVPAVAMVARLTDLGWLKSRKKIYRISALLMVLVGIYFVVNGIRY